jgi:hypothetical protein
MARAVKFEPFFNGSVVLITRAIGGPIDPKGENIR